MMPDGRAHARSDSKARHDRASAAACRDDATKLSRCRNAIRDVLCLSVARARQNLRVNAADIALTAWLACSPSHCLPRLSLAYSKTCCEAFGCYILPDRQPKSRQLFPSGRCRRRPHAGELNRARKGPVFFYAVCSSATRTSIDCRARRRVKISVRIAHSRMKDCFLSLRLSTPWRRAIPGSVRAARAPACRVGLPDVARRPGMSYVSRRECGASPRGNFNRTIRRSDRCGDAESLRAPL